jgi:hypothetical protein
MKIVQSLWSKPGKKNGQVSIPDRNSCGWADRKYNYFSWVLSCLQFKKFYDEVELVTDKEGYDLLINKMELPYTSVKVVLDDLNHYHGDLWALGKIYTYSIQDKPFIHADGDVLIWQKFSNELEQSPLLCQSKEEGIHFNRTYSTIFLSMMQHFNFYPSVLDRSIAKNNGIRAVNAGIIGGCNLDFYKEYTTQAFEFVNRNIDRLSKVDISVSNIVFEQFLFCALAEENKQTVNFFNPNTNVLLNDFADYTGVPKRIQYVHLPGQKLKQQRHLVNSMEYRLLKDHPDYYYKTMNLIRTNQI